jgi:hypothetical protein
LHAKITLRLVYAFSRIAKLLDWYPIALVSHSWLWCIGRICAMFGQPRRPHRPRCPEIRKIYSIAGLPLGGAWINVACVHACMHKFLSSKLCTHGAPGDDGDSDSSGSESSDSESETRLNMHAWSASLVPAFFPPYAAACMHAKLGR